MESLSVESNSLTLISLHFLTIQLLCDSETIHLGKRSLHGSFFASINPHDSPLNLEAGID